MQYHSHMTTKATEIGIYKNFQKKYKKYYETNAGELWVAKLSYTPV